MILCMSQQNMDWFVGFGQYEHHRDSEANSLNELRPAWPNCGVQHGVACAWHRHCTVERKLKCSNVNMWRPELGESLHSFHSKRLFGTLAIFCSIVPEYFFRVEVLGIRFESMKMLALRHAKTYAGSSTSIPTYRTKLGDYTTVPRL